MNNAVQRDQVSMVAIAANAPALVLRLSRAGMKRSNASTPVLLALKGTTTAL